MLNSKLAFMRSIFKKTYLNPCCVVLPAPWFEIQMVFFSKFVTWCYFFRIEQEVPVSLVSANTPEWKTTSRTKRQNHVVIKPQVSNAVILKPSIIPRKRAEKKLLSYAGTGIRPGHTECVCVRDAAMWLVCTDKFLCCGHMHQMCFSPCFVE